MSKRRVVITGLGVISPCGQGWQPYWEAASSGKSYIRQISSLSLNGFPSKFAGEITDFNPSAYIQKRKSLKVMSRTIQLAVGASHLALQDAAVDLQEDIREVFGVSLGSGVINNDLDEMGVGIKKGFDPAGKFEMANFGQSGIRSLYPLWFLKYLPNMPACHISIANGLRGPSNTITTSSAAGAHAIGEAFRIIERGDADYMLAGSTDSKLNAMGISRFHLLGLLSERNHVAHEAYCPFDARHDGLVLGEGAGLMVLEEMESAKSRGARIYAEVAGYGSSADFQIDPREKGECEGKQLSMTRALSDADMSPSDIDFLVANGSGIPQEDVHEAQAINNVFKHSIQDLKVTALKPITGHLVYGSAGVELAAGVLALCNNRIPPLINLEKPHPDCVLPFVGPIEQEHSNKAFLFNSFGFGGQSASLVLRKP